MCLPLLVPFGPFRNIDLQGLVLLLAGIAAWGGLVIGSSRFPKAEKTITRLLALFAGFCLLAILVTPHPAYNLLGAPYIRLGSLGLLSCIGIGLLARQFPVKLVMRYAYCLISLVAVASLPYTLAHYHNLHRVGGVFNQADVFACIIGVGIILGWPYCSMKTWTGRMAWASQLFMAALLIYSQTRVVIALALLLSIVWLYGSRQLRPRQFVGGCVVLIACTIGLLAALPSSRIANRPDAVFSTSYRLRLDQAALSASTHRPIFGYGPGNIADALDCRSLHARALQHTCRTGYFFNSSHNIYLDRVLSFGWVGGLAFTAIVATALLRRPRLTAANLATALIALYYCTNVTSISLEVLFWILLLRSAVDEKPPAH